MIIRPRGGVKCKWSVQTHHSYGLRDEHNPKNAALRFSVTYVMCWHLARGTAHDATTTCINRGFFNKPLLKITPTTS